MPSSSRVTTDFRFHPITTAPLRGPLSTRRNRSPAPSLEIVCSSNLSNSVESLAFDPRQPWPTRSPRNLRRTPTPLWRLDHERNVRAPESRVFDCPSLVRPPLAIGPQVFRIGPGHFAPRHLPLQRDCECFLRKIAQSGRSAFAGEKETATDSAIHESAPPHPERAWLPRKDWRLFAEIECSENAPKGIWLGASFRDAGDKLFYNTSEDKTVSLTKGRKIYERNFTIAKEAPLGERRLDTSIWRGVVGDSQRSKWIAGNPIQIRIT